jgi:hypothetical protein
MGMTNDFIGEETGYIRMLRKFFEPTKNCWIRRILIDDLRKGWNSK